jgi:CRP/FNR family cyclic AMP-dependent transcriptional regulator
MSEVIQIIDADPELGQNLSGERLAAARRDCTGRILNISTYEPHLLEEAREVRFGIGLLILEGLVVRRVGLAGRFGAELLGEGDVLRPWQDEDSGASLPHVGKWRVLEPGRVAVLDGDFTRRACRYPEVISELVGRAIRRSRHMAVNVAIMHQPRIDVRLHMLFWELADRWGTVRADGIHLPLRLTHSVLGELVAARRPTVTKSLGELTAGGAIRWTGDEWILQGEPPAELYALGGISGEERGPISGEERGPISGEERGPISADEQGPGSADASA